MANKLSRRMLVLQNATDAEVTVQQWKGRDHLVVPVVMLMEGVIWPVNAETPELVLIEDIAASYMGWNGIHVVPDHPEVDGVRVSANTPLISEQNYFGLLFNSEIDGKKLKAQAWLDIAEAERLGGNAQSVVERAQNAEPIEVSVGVYVGLEDKSGTYNGKDYVGIWREIVQDHFAMLPEGTIGACSIEMGCGAPRVAIRHLITAEGITMADPKKEQTPPKKIEQRSLKDRLFSLLKFKANETSDQEIRWKLYDALRAIEPGFIDVDYVYQESGTVIYCVRPEQEYLLFRRPFTTDAAGNVTVGDPREQVQPVTDWVVVGTEAISPDPQPVTASAGDCGCKAKDERIMKEKVERIATLLKTNSRFTETFLTTCSDEQLTQLETDEDAKTEADKKAKEEEDAKAAKDAKAKTPTVAAAVPSDEDWMKSAPKSVRDLVTRAQAQEDARRTLLVGKLKTAQDGYTEDELNTLDINHLERLAKVAKVDEPTVAQSVDFSGRGTSRVTASDSQKIDAPPSLFESVRAARAARK